MNNNPDAVQTWLKTVSDETHRRRYHALLKSYFEWSGKTSSELIDEAKLGLIDKGRDAVQLQLERAITEHLDYLKKRKVSEFTRLETEYAIRSLYQANGLPIETDNVEKRIVRFKRRMARAKEKAKEIRAEVEKRLAEKLGISTEDASHIITVSYIHKNDKMRIRFHFSELSSIHSINILVDRHSNVLEKIVVLWSDLRGVGRKSD
jgi:hypothetical protein